MRPPQLRAWNLELKMMIETNEIFTRENIHMLLNKSGDYIWMKDTRVRDKGGKEIYEGDILFREYLSEVPQRFVVVYNELILQQSTCFGYFSDNLEIIGNIYQNPELMEK